jgi:hypothetical protein
MKLSVIILTLSFTLLLTGCTIHQPKQSVIVGPGTFYAKWQKAILEKCSDKAALVTIEIVREKSKEGYVFAERDVIAIHKYLIEKCSVNSGIVI